MKIRLSLLFFVGLLLLTGCELFNQKQKPAFDLSVSFEDGGKAEEVRLIENSTLTLQVSVVSKNGFSGDVQLAADNLPEGVTATFNPTSTRDESILTLTAEENVVEQQNTVVIRGTSEKLDGDFAMKLKVTSTSNDTGYAPGVEGEEKSITIDGEVLWYEVIDGLAIYQGDMILGTAEQVANLPGGVEVDKVDSQGIRCDEVSIYCEKWSDDRILYSVADNWGSDKNNETMRKRIAVAIAEWENKTGLQFIPATSGDRMRFTNSKGCSSTIGFLDNPLSDTQDVNLNMKCGKGSIIHEIGHAIGLHHEQNRSDRDDHVKIFFDNIEEGKMHNFDTPFFATDIGEYDYGSIMHYDELEFSKNNRPTIETIPPGIAIGQRDGLSEGDVQAAYYIYRPKYSISGPSGVVLQDNSLLTYSLNFNVKPVADEYIQWGSSRQAGLIGTGKILSLNARNLPLGQNTLTARIVIKGMTLAERSIQLNVQEILGNVTVVFDSITVHDDHDGAGKGAGDIWLDYKINGIAGRWPDSGEVHIHTRGQSRIDRAHSLTLRQSDNLSIFVNGQESDYPDADDNMGTINVTYSSADNWGEGWHRLKSSNGSYTLHFYVTLTGEPPPIE